MNSDCDVFAVPNGVNGSGWAPLVFGVRGGRSGDALGGVDIWTQATRAASFDNAARAIVKMPRRECSA